jgi:hypothetical protein
VTVRSQKNRKNNLTLARRFADCNTKPVAKELHVIKRGSCHHARMYPSGKSVKMEKVTDENKTKTWITASANITSDPVNDADFLWLILAFLLANHAESF